MNDDDAVTEARIPLAAACERARSGRVSLLVMSHSGMSTVPLPESGEVVIGRSDDCDVRVDDGRLSRRHVKLCIGETIEIVDLGSLNGTTVREKRIAPQEPIEISEGDMIGIGSTALMLQSAPMSVRPRHIWSHGYFEARIEEECVRATHGAAPFAITRLRVHDTQAARAEEMIGGWLRPVDILASYAPGEYEILHIKTMPAEADGLARDLTAMLVSGGVTADIGVASYPRDGRTPEALVARAGALLRGTASESAVSSSSIVTTGALGRLDPIINRIAVGVINVLVLGETGVGKEILARAIHDRSPRAKKPMLCINCAALSESLLESELFGHEKGAFTGAVQAKPGLLESAQGGSVFLDEIGEMPLSLQAKLLRVLEQREVTRVGAVRPNPIDVRFIAATNRDLEAEIAERRFRNDLYFRLNGIAISLPPLRERIDEIEPLARAFVVDACKRVGRRPNVDIDAAALALLKTYQWPGNIRELRNVVERAVLLCSGGTILVAHLPAEKMGPLLPSISKRTPGRAFTVPSRPQKLASHAASPALPSTRGSTPTLPPSADNAAAWDAVTQSTNIASLGLTPNEQERMRVVAALERCAGNQSQAAKMLGVSRRTLINRIEQFNLPRPRKRDDTDEG